MKRTVITILWLLVGWYVGSAGAWLFGLGPLVAPVAALALAAFVFADPSGRLWARGQGAAPASIPPSAAADPDTRSA